jgi:hypothetical protein
MMYNLDAPESRKGNWGVSRSKEVEMPILWFVFAVVAAIIAYPASQAPEFKNQYTQRIGGHVDELRVIVHNFDQDASRSNIDRSQALGLLKKNPEPFVRAQGVRMEENILRLERLQDQKIALEGGGMLDGMITLALHYEQQLFDSTRESYKPAWTGEGVLFGALVFTMSLLGMILAAPMLLGRRREVES